jgi:hypothetical protein
MTAAVASAKRCKKVLLPAACIVGLIGCDQRQYPVAEPPSPTVTPDEEYDMPAFVGQAWLSTTRGHPPGSVRIFLTDGTLLIGSCTDAYRLAPWGMVAEDRIRWAETAIPVEAQFEQPSPDGLTFRIVGRSQAETYVRAAAPYACPGER